MKWVNHLHVARGFQGQLFQESNDSMFLKVEQGVVDVSVAVLKPPFGDHCTLARNEVRHHAGGRHLVAGDSSSNSSDFGD